MPTVACRACSNAVSLPDPPAAAVYSCPHCRQPVPAPGRKPAPKAPPKPAAFEFDAADDEPDEPAPRSRAPRRTSYGASSGPSWLTLFTATLAANVLAGVILLLGVRAYIYWSIHDTLDKAREAPTQRVK